MQHPRTRLAIQILALPLLVASAHAQELLFEEDFEQGIANWTISNPLWHPLHETNSCASEVLPLPSGSWAMRFGNSVCNFDDWFNWAGNLTLNTPVAIPSTANSASLTIWSYDETECWSCGWDWRFVYVSADNGETWEFVGESDRGDQWYQPSWDLSPYIGSSVLVRFRFNAFDNATNGGLGWVVDDVRITADLCSSVTNYCTAAPNSASASGAVMGYTGTKRVHLDNFALTLDGAPPGQFAHFFYGAGTAHTPVADGFLCVSAGPAGLVRLTPSGQIDASGHLERPLDIPGTLAIDNPNWVTAGSTWNFQGWYRDPSGAGTGSNFTDGLQVTFCP